MPLASMTGYARTSFEVNGDKFFWEIKSVNGRGLEIRSRLPPGFEHLDADVRKLARERIVRGTCSFVLHEEGGSHEGELTIDEAALRLVVAAAHRLAAVEGFATARADGLLAIPGVLKERGGLPPADAAEVRDGAVLQALWPALDALTSARQEEGRRLQTVLEDQLAAMEGLVASAAALATEAPDLLRARIREQVDTIMADAPGLDADRLHQEAILAATRSDVREELDRLRSHIAAARELIKSGAPVGRRLEFLTQEFNREANTLCSKAFDARLTGVGLELKAVVDQLREQAQNLE